MLGGLQLGAVRRLKDEADAFGHGEVLRSVPPGVVELKHDPLLVAGSCGLGEVEQDRLEHLLADRVRDVPHGAPRGRLDEARHVEPLEAMMAERDWTLAPRRPYAARDRLQADAMLVRRPDLDLSIRML